MICHVCQRPASMQCKRCYSFVCGEHSAYRGLCTSCQRDDQRREEARQLAREQEEYQRRFCHFCGGASRSAPPSEPMRCSRCNRQFCEQHGQYIYESHPGDARWIRCCEHLDRPGLYGVHEAPYNPVVDCLGVLLGYLCLAWLIPLCSRRPDYLLKDDGTLHPVTGFNFMGEWR